MRIAASRPTRRHRGFTLLEVMITVAIVGILSAIALPMYFDQVMRSKIIDGTTKALDFKAKMDGYFRDNRTYQAGGGGCGVGNPAVSPADYFQITCAAPTANTYLIQASGIASKGMGGFVYQVDQTNAKSTTGVPAGWTPSGACWVLRKDGSC